MHCTPAGGAVGKGAARFPDRKGDRLQPQALAGVGALHRGRHLSAGSNWVENQIRPIAIAHNNWLFAGSLRTGRPAAAVMSLVHSAKLNGREPHACVDVMQRLPTQPASRTSELLPHRWHPARA